mmetsp:Transcript_95866/g.228347  ORF Transcript_95866/g.228347 Transcript_95866/m.228347 type:complete len:203 (-) Transcript_95866:186-794(-)
MVAPTPVDEVGILPVVGQRRLAQDLGVVASDHLFIQAVFAGEAHCAIVGEQRLQLSQGDLAKGILQVQIAHVHHKRWRDVIPNNLALDRGQADLHLAALAVPRAAPKPRDGDGNGHHGHLARDVPLEAHKHQLLVDRVGGDVFHDALLDPSSDVESEKSTLEEVRQVPLLLVKGNLLHLSLVEGDLPVGPVLANHTRQQAVF